MVDRVLVLRKLADLDRYREQIGGFREVTAEQYTSDWQTQRIVERTLQMMIETCVDVANHLISDRGARVPQSYADSFRVLREMDLLDEDLAGELVRMTGFRNIIVHNYDRIDPSLVTGLLRTRLGDFLRFRDAVLRALDS